MMSPAGGRHGKITMRLAARLAAFVEAVELGEVFAAETGFLLERDPDTVRAPDIAFIASERVHQADTSGFICVPPDLAVETLSPDDRASRVNQKIQWWLDHGVRQVWVVDIENQTVSIHPCEGQAQLLRQGESLSGVNCSKSSQ